MPPKAKISKEMILTTVLNLTRESGFETVNARSIAERLHCSTRPLFTCYKNMEELKREFLNFAFDFYCQYVEVYRKSVNTDPRLLFPLSYINFAKEETHVFRLLFISDMDLNMKDPQDFYTELGNERNAQNFSKLIGVDPERGKMIFLDLFLYSHGIAVLTASGKLSFNRTTAESMITTMLSACIKQEVSHEHECTHH